MKKTLMAAGLLAALVQPALAADDDLRELRATRGDKGDWELIRNDSIRNIKTFGKQEDGKRIRSFKGEAEFEASLETLARTDVYYRAYKNMTLDSWAENERWRRAGAQVPSAPPRAGW